MAEVVEFKALQMKQLDSTIKALPDDALIKVGEMVHAELELRYGKCPHCENKR